MLLNRCSGMPLFMPTVYTISMIRAKNVASATISRNLQAIMHLYAWAEIGRFDLEKRFSRGEFLNISEMDSLTEALGNRFDHYCKIHSARESDLEALARPRVSSLEKYRLRSRDNASSVDVATKAVRLRYARGYLDWLAGYHLRGNLHDSKKYAVLEGDRRFMAEAIAARVPTVGDKNFLGQRVGLKIEDQIRLEEIIDPASSENPWTNQDARLRNSLIVRLLLKLGVRVGELLSIRVEDINFQENKLLVPRRPDDKDDSRNNEPNAKTIDRYLPFDEKLRKLLFVYISTVRNKNKRARKHKFLLVELHDGKPLSKSAVTKMFHKLRKHPDLPDDLTTHVLRHTWNERFSELMDKNRVPEEREMQMRSELMGWKKGSRTAATYLRRYIQRKATEASLLLQQPNKINRKDNEEEDVPF